MHTRTLLSFLAASVLSLPAHAIINGSVPGVSQFAFLDRVVVVKRPGGMYCTGFVLTPRTVLTAAHCLPLPFKAGSQKHPSGVIELIRSQYGVRRGDEVFAAADAMSHTADPDPEHPAQVRLRPYPNELGDIAILFLERDFPLRVGSGTVDLGYDALPETLNPTYGYGYGRRSNGDRQGGSELRAFLFNWEPDYGSSKDKDRITYFLEGNVVGGASCNGDSGGPLLSWSASTASWHLTGVFSSHTGTPIGDCERARLNTASSVYWHRGWIQQAVRSLHLRNGVQPPQSIAVGSPPRI